MAVAFDIVGGPHARSPLTEEHGVAKLPAPEQVHARCARKIRRHVRRVMGTDDEHEDLVQEVLVTVLRKLESVRDPSRFDAWVAQVTTNTLRHTMRQRRARRHALGTFLAQQKDESVKPDVEARYLADRAMRVMGRLSPSERELLAAEWFTPGTGDALLASIATRSRCSVFTVRRRLSRARTRFEMLARRDPALAQYLARAERNERRPA